jgi:hypothetical protein
MNKTENAIEPCTIVGLSFPCDDLATKSFEHFTALGYEIRN